MSPITHALVAWVLSNAPAATTRRERILVTLGGIVPDVDGLGIVPDVLTRWAGGAPTRYFHEYHHDLHTLAFAAVATAAAAALAPRGARARTALLACLAFHLHLLCDVVGARGPAADGGNQWPIPYLAPFTDAVQWTWSGQWELNAWPNFAITGVLLLATGLLAVRRGRSIVEVASARADAAVVATLRRRFGRAGSAGQAVEEA